MFLKPRINEFQEESVPETHECVTQKPQFNVKLEEDSFNNNSSIMEEHLSRPKKKRKMTNDKALTLDKENKEEAKPYSRTSKAQKLKTKSKFYTSLLILNYLF